jgi:hypothetical protein
MMNHVLLFVCHDAKKKRKQKKSPQLPIASIPVVKGVGAAAI